MKTLILIRHAEANLFSNTNLDFDRTLSEKGIQDAKEMGRRLKTHSFLVEKIISSSAIRTTQTIQKIVKEIEFTEKKIFFTNDLYNATAQQIQQVVFEVENDIDTLIIVCHNIGITDFANSISGIFTYCIEPCGIVAFTFETNEWKNIYKVKNNFLFYEKPQE